MRLSANDDHNDNDNDKQEGIPGDDETTEQPAAAAATKTTTTKDTVITIVDKASEYFVLVAGAGVATSLALNVLGYGFAARPGGGVRFDTIEQLRTERQMERSVDLPGVYASGPRNPALSFFRKNPLLVTLALTGATLVVEEIRARKDN